MNENTPLHEAFPASSPTAALRARVAALSDPRPRRLAWRPALAGAASAAVLAVGAALMPRPATAAEMLRQVEDGLVGHARTYRIADDGSRVLVAEGWYAPGEARVRVGDATFLSSRRLGRSMAWSPERGSLALADRAGAFDVRGLPRALDPGALAELARRHGAEDPPRLIDANLEGARVKAARLHGATFYASPTDLRLVGVEVDEPDGRFLTLVEGRPPALETFVPEVSYAGRTFDPFAERERVGAELARPVAVYSAGGGRVQVRRVVADPQGDLFVLYTAEGADDVPTAATDDAGNAYRKGPAFAASGQARGGAWPGYAFGGSPLRGAWFVRVGHRAAREARVAFGTPSLEHPEPAFVHRQVISSAPGSLDFMPFMSMGLGNRDRLEEARSLALAWQARDEERWPDMERAVRRHLELGDPFFARQGWGNGAAHAALAEALLRQGRREEARAELAVARARMEGSRRALGQRETVLGQTLGRLDAEAGP